MYRKKIYVVILIWLAILGIGVNYFSSTTATDIEMYQGITEQKKQGTKIHQERSNVRKHLLLTKGEERLHWYLGSPQAELVIDQEQHASSISENFKEVEGIMQEELVYLTLDGRFVQRQSDGRWMVQQRHSSESPVLWVEDPSTLQPYQWVRYLKASKAMYNYQTKQLHADEVSIARYLLPGHQWTDSFERWTPFLKGQAQFIDISLTSEKESFRAHGFQATLPGKMP
jgi:hypothetical protein